MFPYFFLAVVEREMATRGINNKDDKTKDGVIEELLPFVMHYQRNLMWVLTHKLRKFGLWKGIYAVTSETTTTDAYIAQVCRIVLQQDPNALREVPRTEPIHESSVGTSSKCFGGSIAEFAIRHGTLEVITIICEVWLRSDVELCIARGTLIEAAMSRLDDQEAVVGFLVDRYLYCPQPPRQRSLKIRWLLKTSYMRGYVLVVKRIFERSRELDRDSIHPMSFYLYQYAIRCGQLPVLEWLFVQEEVDINMANRDTGFGLLIIVIRNWRERLGFEGRVTSMLHKKGRRSSTRYPHTKDERIRLQLLADSAVAVLEILLDLGANANGLSRRDESSPGVEIPVPLFMAATEGLVKGMDLLLKRGADPRRIFDGGSLLVAARQGGIRRQAIKLLKKYG